MPQISSPGDKYGAMNAIIVSPLCWVHYRTKNKSKGKIQEINLIEQFESATCDKEACLVPKHSMHLLPLSLQCFTLPLNASHIVGFLPYTSVLTENSKYSCSLIYALYVRLHEQCKIFVSAEVHSYIQEQFESLFLHTADKRLMYAGIR